MTRPARETRRQRGARLGRGRGTGRRLPQYIDVRRYLVEHNYVRSRREAAEALESGKVSINGKTYAYPHFPHHELDYDSCGRPRIMVERVPDPRPCK